MKSQGGQEDEHLTFSWRRDEAVCLSINTSESALRVDTLLFLVYLCDNINSYVHEQQQRIV